MGSAFCRQKRGISVELSHTLVCYRVVSGDSPAFALIKTIDTIAGHPQDILQHMWEVFLECMTDLIHKGAVSKCDHLPNGMNLLHVSNHFLM